MSYPGAVDTEAETQAWRLSVCVSLAIHIAALAGLALFGLVGSLTLTFRRPPLGDVLEVTYTKVTPAGPGERAPDIVDSIIGSIPDRLEQAKNMPPEERAKKVKKGLQSLSLVRESSIEEIAELFAAEDRAYEPVVPPPPGPFDFDSQIPYSMEKTADGGYRVTFLDKDGRTLTMVHAREEVTEDMNAAYEAFQMMDRMPAFKKLYMRFAAQYLPRLKGE